MREPQLDALCRALEAGEAVLVPTDTVYGVAALVGSGATREVYRLKQRPDTMALPWLVSGVDALLAYGADVPDAAYRLARMFWPGAVTLIVRASQTALATGDAASDGTVALRCPDDAVCRALLDALALPLACSSANAHGKPAASEISKLDERFRDLVGFDGIASSCPGSAASTIVDCTNPVLRIVRDGPIPAHVVWDVATFDDTL